MPFAGKSQTSRRFQGVLANKTLLFSKLGSRPAPERGCGVLWSLDCRGCGESRSLAALVMTSLEGMAILGRVGNPLGLLRFGAKSRSLAALVMTSLRGMAI